MRIITEAEKLMLTSLLSMETINLANAKLAKELIQDDEFKNQLDSFIQASERKVKDMQEFINEKGITTEVH